jgi:hypothetical protein
MARKVVSMIDLASINKRLEVLGLMSVEEFCALYNARFHDAPVMLTALVKWQETYNPIRLERLVGKRLARFSELPWQYGELDQAITLLEDDHRRELFLVELRKVRTARQLDKWVSVYFLEIDE